MPTLHSHKRTFLAAGELGALPVGHLLLWHSWRRHPPVLGLHKSQDVVEKGFCRYRDRNLSKKKHCFLSDLF